MRRRIRIDLSQDTKKRPALNNDAGPSNSSRSQLEDKKPEKLVDVANKEPGSKQTLRQQLDNLEYGNYPGYYQYRNVPKQGDSKDADQHDSRLDHLKKEWFKGNDVLDIGCNRGEITFYVAKVFEPRRIVGLDIDDKLIRMAQKGLQLHVKHLIEGSVELRKGRMIKQQQEAPAKDSSRLYIEDPLHFPISAYMSNGPLVVPSKLDDLTTAATTTTNTTDESRNSSSECIDSNQPPVADDLPPSNAKDADGSDNLIQEMRLHSDLNDKFPNNLTFMVHDYVLSDDHLVEQQEASFDVILCLSVTKWIHLNYRDDGLKRFFRRIYKHLRPNGGILILEAQPFVNYVRRKKLSPRIKENYQSLQFKPEQFESYLLSDQVGFTSCHNAGLPNHEHLGFQRPIQVFRKG